MGKRRKRLRALEEKRKSSALTETTVSHKKINLLQTKPQAVVSKKGKEDGTDVQAFEGLLSALQKKHAVAVRSTLRNLIKEVKSCAPEFLESQFNRLVDAVFPFLVDQDVVARDSVPVIFDILLQRTQKPQSLPRGVLLYLEILFSVLSTSSLKTCALLVSTLGKYRTQFVLGNYYELLNLFVEVLQRNSSPSGCLISFESSEEQLLHTVEFFESLETLLQAFISEYPIQTELDVLVRNNIERNGTIWIHRCETDYMPYRKVADTDKWNSDILLCSLSKLIDAICYTIRSFGKDPVIAAGRPLEKKLLCLLCRILSETTQILSCFGSFSPFLNAENYQQMLLNILSTSQLSDNRVDEYLGECCIHTAQFSLFLYRSLQASKPTKDGSQSPVQEQLLTTAFSLCRESLETYLKDGSLSSEGEFILVSQLISNIIDLASMDSALNLVEKFLQVWTERNSFLQTNRSCLALLWKIITKSQLLNNCTTSMTNVIRQFPKVAWNSLQSQNMKSFRRFLYLLIAASPYFLVKYNIVYSEAQYAFKSFLGKRTDNASGGTWTLGPFVFLDSELKRAILSLIFQSETFRLDCVELLLVCVQNQKCIMDGTSITILGFLSEILRRVSPLLHVDEKIFIASLIIISVCRVIQWYSELEQRRLIGPAKSCLLACHVDPQSCVDIIEKNSNKGGYSLCQLTEVISKAEIGQKIQTEVLYNAMFCYIILFVI